MIASEIKENINNINLVNAIPEIMYSCIILLKATQYCVF